MPPWLPEEGYGKFRDERRLSDEQIRTISEWVRAGAPEGSPEQRPPIPHFTQGWQLGPPDLVITATSPFVVPASGPDVFWNFVFNPDVKATRYVRAIEILPAGLTDDSTKNTPGSTKIVHHANLLIDRTGSVLRLEQSPGAGFGGMEITLDRNPLDPPSYFLFWKPGSAPYSEPAGFSWRLDPGNLLVLNTHLQTSGRSVSIRPSIGLYFTDQKPTEFPLLMELEDDEQLNIPAGSRDFNISDEFTLPMDVDVLAIYPHAHYLGKQLEAHATLPDGSRKWLIKIPDWDLNWQAVYRYQDPVFLPKGSVVAMRYSYDNSKANVRNPNTPPKRVKAGNQADEEMGHLWLEVLPCGRGDRRRPFEEALLQHRLSKNPNDFEAYLNLGALLLSQLHTQAAISELETAVRLNEKRPEAHDMLGSAYRSVGRGSDAVVQYRLALMADPSYMDARYNLATSLARSGNLREAVADMRLVVTAFPKSSRLQNEFGEMLARDGELRDALLHFDKAVELDPANKNAASNRNWVVAHSAGKLTSNATKQ